MAVYVYGEYNGKPVILPEPPAHGLPFELIWLDQNGIYCFGCREDTETFVKADGTVANLTGQSWRLKDGAWTSGAVQFGVPIWANFPLYDTGGNLVIAASEPVPVTTINPSALMQWFFVGDAIKRMRGVQPEQPEPEQPSGNIVGYLYGGVGPLPDVNGAYEALAKYFGAEVEQVKQVYPYATVIYNSAGDNHRIFLFGALPYVNGENCMIPDASAATIFDVEENAWVFKGTELFNYGYDAILGEKEALVWASHDVLNADGSTYLAASDPVPVYE